MYSTHIKKDNTSANIVTFNLKKSRKSPFCRIPVYHFLGQFISLFKCRKKNFCVSAKMFTLIRLMQSVFVISEKNFFMDSPRKWFFRKKGTFGAFYKWVYCLNVIKICYYFSVVLFNTVCAQKNSKSNNYEESNDELKKPIFFLRDDFH